MDAITARVWFWGKDTKETENQVAIHLSRLEDEDMCEVLQKVKIDYAFPDEHVLAAYQDLIPWSANFSNYLAVKLFLQSSRSIRGRNSCMTWKSSFRMSLTYTEFVPMGLFPFHTPYWDVELFEGMSLFANGSTIVFSGLRIRFCTLGTIFQPFPRWL